MDTTTSSKSCHYGQSATLTPLPWSAYVRLLSVKSSEARALYESETLRSGWPVRQLDRQIGSQFYERLALSKSIGTMLEKAVVPKASIRLPQTRQFETRSYSIF